ncbi:3-hydroxybutyrate oligomer hydrolase family protein [Paracoccaceae bacterium GXU_MW_L88]
MSALFKTTFASICLFGISPVQSAFAQSEAPEWLRVMDERVFDGETDDLVTAGLGVEGMIAGTLSEYADPLNPTAAELRRASLGTNGTVGFGTLYGPNVDASTGEVSGDGKAAGTEYLAYGDDGSGQQNVSFLLQVPTDFDRTEPCVLAVPVSGSNSLYRDVGIIGYWGLQKNCAVVYTDKGLGNGFHDLERDRVTLIDGTRSSAEAAGADAHFKADLTEEARNAFLEEYPHRIAFKHAHSKQNPDASWGRDVVRSIEFALYQLNNTNPESEPLTADNTLVIVAGNSNGGGAALYAGEYDDAGLIDGIVAAQPQVQLDPDDRVSVSRGETTREGTGKSLLDYFTYGLIYQPCATLATPDAPWADRVTQAAQRCESLIEKDLVDADTVEGAAAESLQNLRDYGWEPESDALHPSHFVIAPTATAMKYASSHGRLGVEDRVCGLSIASVGKDGLPRPVPEAEIAPIFANAPGGAPTGSIVVINDLDPRGPIRNDISQSSSTGREDYNLDGALCLRELVAGDSDMAIRVQEGIDDLTGDADLHGTPTIIVHGRADARVPIGFTSRPYLGLNNLTGDADLPPSQVVRAEVSDEGPGEDGSGLIMPEISADPGDDLISVEDGHVTVPD